MNNFESKWMDGIAIARAMLRRPKILLLGTPFLIIFNL